MSEPVKTIDVTGKKLINGPYCGFPIVVPPRIRIGSNF
jgi:hypothetical protein